MRLKKSLLSLALAFFSAFSIGQKAGPQADFERLWQQFDRNYALFELKKVDWQAVREKYEPRVTASTTREELADVFESMLEPLRDGHVSVLDLKNEEIIFKGQSARDSFNLLFKNREADFWAVADQNLTASGFEKPASIGPPAGKRKLAPIYFSKTTDGRLGYVRLTRFFFDKKGVTGSSRDTRKDEKTLRQTFAEIIRSFEKCEGLIVDLRPNGGGHSGLELASHFADADRTAVWKRTKKASGLGDFEPFFVKKAEKGPVFLKKTIVLTSDKTASAAEDFALGLAVCPSVELFGQATRGTMSDIFSFDLKWSGWAVTLSNQQYFSTEKALLEDRGVRPDRVFALDPAAFESGRDPLILAAIEALKKGK